MIGTSRMTGTESRCADPAGSASKKLDCTTSTWPASTRQLSVASCRLCRKVLRGVGKGEERSAHEGARDRNIRSHCHVSRGEGDAVSGVLCARGVLSGERSPIERCGRIVPRPSGKIPTTALPSAHCPRPSSNACFTARSAPGTRRRGTPPSKDAERCKARKSGNSSRSRLPPVRHVLGPGASAGGAGRRGL